MTITWEVLLKWFYNISAAITILGLFMLAFDGDFDIYSVWIGSAMGVGLYLINKKT